MVLLEPRVYQELREDGRMSFAELSRRTGIPRAVVSAQVRAALRSGDLRIVAAVNPQLLGYSTILHLGIRVGGPCDPIVKMLRETPAVVFLSRCAGVYDLAVEIRGRSRFHLRRLTASIRAAAGVVEVRTLSYESILKSPLRVPPGRERLSDIDLDDRMLIFLLQQDGRMSFDALAQQTRLSPARARARVRRLIDAQILAVRAVRGRRSGTAETTVSAGIWARSERVAAEIAADPQIDFLAATLGEYDFLASISAPDPVAAADALERLRSRDGVVGAETWTHLDIVRERDDVTGTPR